MTASDFLTRLQTQISRFAEAVATSEGDWIVKGFVDVYGRVYALSLDTKVVSKVLEVLLYPILQQFAEANDLTIELSPQQNFYPDITLVAQDGTKFAVDIKSTYWVSESRVNGMTLGAFTGYFRNRTSNKNTLYPYGQYAGHFVLGVIYSQSVIEDLKDTKYDLASLESIPSVIRNFTFFVHPKYRIASASPGSGNTKNIGSVVDIDRLTGGTGIFESLGEEVYNDYWVFFLTADMARAFEIPRPYFNLTTYLAYKQRAASILQANAQAILELAENEPPVTENEVD